MSITVVIARDEYGAPTTREVYADASKFSMDNGNLSIVSNQPKLLAVYGSGNWLTVHVDDHVEVVVTKPEESSDDSGGFDFGSDDDSSSDTGGLDFDFGTDDSTDDSAETESASDEPAEASA